MSAVTARKVRSGVCSNSRLLGALALTRLLRSQLFGLEPTDPVTFAAVSALLVGVALLASWVPARRAAAVAPTIALREE